MKVASVPELERWSRPEKGREAKIPDTKIQAQRTDLYWDLNSDCRGKIRF